MRNLIGLMLAVMSFGLTAGEVKSSEDFIVPKSYEVKLFNMDKNKSMVAFAKGDFSALKSKPVMLLSKNVAYVKGCVVGAEEGNIETTLNPDNFEDGISVDLSLKNDFVKMAVTNNELTRLESFESGNCSIHLPQVKHTSFEVNLKPGFTTHILERGGGKYLLEVDIK